MPPADGLPPLREVIGRYGLAAKKSLGQNFLLDLNLTRRIARSAGLGKGARVLEIGPGPGGLTRALLEQGCDVIAIERDPRFLPALQDIAAAYPGRLEIIEQDALDLDETRLGSLPVVANLPYNVGTVLLMKWLTVPAWPPWWSGLTLMFQREVAERLVAATGTKAYGRISVLAQWRAATKILFDVPAAAFVPPPKVTSSVLRVEPLPAPRAEAELGALTTVLGAAFGQRRKMLRQSLKSLGVPAEVLIAEAGLDPTQRAETVGVEGFCALARAYRNLK